MQLTVLGSGTLQPTAKRGCSGYFVQIKNTKILLDAGSGALRQLAKMNVTAEDTDFIFFTHLHIDHTADLVPFLFAKRNSIVSTKKNIAIFGPPGFQQFFSKLIAIYDKSIQPEGYELTVREYTADNFGFKDFSITFMPMKHSDNSYGLRIEDTKGRIIAYTGDTEYCDNLIPLCRNSDIAIIECSFPDSSKTEGHLTPSEVGKAAELAECKSVLLTHLYPIADESDLVSSCSRHFSGKLAVAEELKTITVGENSEIQ